MNNNILYVSYLLKTLEDIQDSGKASIGVCPVYLPMVL